MAVIGLLEYLNRQAYQCQYYNVIKTMNTHKARQDLVMMLEARLRQRMAEHRLGGMIWATRQAMKQLLTSEEVATKLGMNKRTLRDYTKYLEEPKEIQLFRGKRLRYLFPEEGVQRLRDLMTEITSNGYERVQPFVQIHRKKKEDDRGHRERKRTSSNGSRTRR